MRRAPCLFLLWLGVWLCCLSSTAFAALRYVDNEALNLRIGYPESVVYAESRVADPIRPTLMMRLTSLRTLEHDDPAACAAAVAERSALAANKGLRPMDNEVPGSVSVLTVLRGVRAKTCLTLRKPDKAVVFELLAVFYLGDYRVVVTLAGPTRELIDEAPGFFTKDHDAPGVPVVWNSAGHKDVYEAYYQSLILNRSGPAASEWLAAFNAIVNGIQVLSQASAEKR